MGWKILTSTGAVKQTDASGVSTPTQTILTASSGTYTLPTGCTEIRVECVGQGGGGGGVNNTSSGQVAVAGGGGGGAYAASLIANPAPSYAYVVGQGSNGGAAGNNSGTAGADTTFGSTIVVAKGGSPGTGAANQAAPQYTAGGAGGLASGSTGTITINGGGGGAGQAPVASGTAPGGGYGGSTVFAEPTAYTQSSASAGTTGNSYGGGGAGAVRTASTGSHAGGNGGTGVIIVTEYYGTPTVDANVVPTPTKTIYTSGSGTYSPPAACAMIFVECVGGGGAGGPCNAAPASGGGGGGGSYAAKTILNPASSYAYAVGGGGTSASYPTTSNPGTDTTFGSTVVVAKGGSGGVAGGTVTPPTPGGGPVSGGLASSSTGDIAVDGESSQVGQSMSSVYVLGGQGGGGAGPYGGKQANTPDSSTGTGAPGKPYGGGGSGGIAVSAGTAQVGGAGAGGVIVITEYYSKPSPFIPISSQPKFTSQPFSVGPPVLPVDGDIWYATSAGVSGEVWTFRYNASSSSAYKWEFVGGSPVYVSYDYPGGLSIGNSTYTAITGLSLTAARAGDYLFYANGQIDAGAVGQPEVILGISQNSTSAVIAGAYMGFPELSGSTTPPYNTMGGQFKVLGAAASDVFRLLAYSSSTGTNTVAFARLSIVPVRVS